jgi:hypothetical protein
MRVRKSVLSGIVLSIGLLTAFGSTASAHPGHEPAPSPGNNGSPPAATPVDTSGSATFLVAELNGRNEVPVAGGPAVGDQDGKAKQIVKIQGNQVSFSIAWKGIAAPTAAHIHEGKAGANGAVKVPFFGAGLPGTLDTVVGKVTVDDKALLDSLKKNPGNFYANLHTAEFPGGAVRAQFRKLDRGADLNDALRLDNGKFFSFGTGGQEVDANNGKPVNDKDGFSISQLKVNSGSIDFSFRWANVSAPTNGHLHKGAIGVNGAVVADLFAASAGLPASISGVSGSLGNVPADVISGLKQNAIDFYTNLHTTEFSGGAVRGQLFRIG